MRTGRVLHHQEGQTRSMDARALRTTSDSFLPLCMQQGLGCQELLGEKGGWEPESQAHGNLWPIRGLPGAKGYIFWAGRCQVPGPWFHEPGSARLIRTTNPSRPFPPAS